MKNKLFKKGLSIETRIINKTNNEIKLQTKKNFWGSNVKFHNLSSPDLSGESLLTFIFIMKCREKNIRFLNEEEMSYLIKNSNLNHLNSWNMNALMILQESGTCPMGLTREMVDYLLLNTDLSIESSPRKRKFLDLLIETDNCLGFTDKQLDFIISSHNAISDDVYAVILMALKYMSGKNIFSENQIKIILDKKPYIKKDSSGIYQLTPKFLALTKSPSENIEKIMRFFDIVNTGLIISTMPCERPPHTTPKI